MSPYYNFDINTRTKRINVISVNDTTKTITGMFGGAYSGTYQVEIRYKDEKIDTTGVILTVGSKVTSYSP